MHRIYISEELDQNELMLTGDAHHYVTRVVRLKPGDRLILFNESRWEWVASIIDIDCRQVRVGIEDKRSNPCEPTRSVSLLQGFPKGNKFFEIVRSTTALGVKEIVPFMAQRSVGGRAVKSNAWLERCERIAFEASRQCGRLKTPEVCVPHASLSEALDRVGSFSNSIRGVCFWEEATNSIEKYFEFSKDQIQKNANTYVVIGPEGGLTRKEAMDAESRGLILCHLGPRILRTELAPVVGLSVLQLYLGEMK